MSKKSSSKTNFLAQGTILVIASFVAKAIGMIYRIPLTHILGDDGNGYYSTANEIYTIILMISSFSLPLAVSRLVAEREYAGEVKNSYRVLICSLRFANFQQQHRVSKCIWKRDAAAGNSGIGYGHCGGCVQRSGCGILHAVGQCGASVRAGASDSRAFG